MCDRHDAGETLSDLGMTPGASYIWIWGLKPDQIFTLEISAVPEPSTWAMMLVGFAGLGFLGYRQRQKLAGAASV